MRECIVYPAALMCLLSLLSSPLRAQGEAEAPVVEEVSIAEPVDGKIVLEGIEWELGPCAGGLGSEAEIQVPDGLVFTGKQGTATFLTQNQNTTSGLELGTVRSLTGRWFVIFTYEPSGHVKDEDKDDLDADDLLASIREGNEFGNAERKKRGWEMLQIDGWHKPPFYDPKTNNLTWSLFVSSKHGRSVNWSTKLLGRTGTMHVDLVADPEGIDAAVMEFESLIGGFAYKAGHTYAEFKPGDKVAEYGLAALVAGGAGAVALKTGLFAKLLAGLTKFWKFIGLGLVAVFIAVKKFFGFGKQEISERADS
ncbi:MAG: DUF2167 domain-containing protein [Planctomycetes bacterium]|nr:DUF2167 domain-containing protein [Planctomycetota bacterium]